jgi:hypothetical protein
MGFLRRLLGGGESSDAPEAKEADSTEPDAGELDASERAHELEVLRAEHERFDELTQRQLRYADYAWQPPAQGGERRADDEDARDAT